MLKSTHFDQGRVDQARGLSLTLAWALGLLLATAAPASTVVELYTSEGCSSCPPAEAMLGKLAQRTDVIALAFHVDYWDYIGWQDRFELKEATQRQREYARALHLASVYTPQLVIDGTRDLVGGGDPARVLPAAHVPAGLPVDIAVKDGQLTVRVGAAARASGPDEVVLVGYLPEAVSQPNRGENSGKELHEFNVVRSIRTLGGWNGAAQSYTVALNSLPADALRVAVLVQVAHNGAIEGAAAQSVR